MTTSSTGGVMGKMIDAQSIMVACAACYDDPTSAPTPSAPSSAECGGIPWAGAAVIGLIALLQAYVFPGSIPTR